MTKLCIGALSMYTSAYQFGLHVATFSLRRGGERDGKTQRGKDAECVCLCRSGEGVRQGRCQHKSFLNAKRPQTDANPQ